MTKNFCRFQKHLLKLIKNYNLVILLKPNKKYYKKKKPEKDFIKTEDIIENKDINMQGLWT